MISSLTTDVFSSNVTRSMAMLTTSPTMTRRSELTVEQSVSRTSKHIVFSSRSRTDTWGTRDRPLATA